MISRKGIAIVASLVASSAAFACGAAIVGPPPPPPPTEPCQPEFELHHGACVYVGGYDIPGAARADAGR